MTSFTLHVKLYTMKHIVIVEDDPDILEPMTIILLSAGYEISGFGDGSSLVEGNYRIPDIFLLDRHLPGINGLDLCRFLKTQQNTKDIPVIIISASYDIAALAKQAMADGSLPKPFRMLELRAIVAHYIH